jgi:hypothetical protein
MIRTRSIRRRAVVLAVTLTALGAVAIAAASPGGSASRSIVLGKTANYPESGCPAPERCEVVARVTGIQMMADGAAHPFRAPADGQLVAFWLKLPVLHKSQVASFSKLFGGKPAARVAVLRRGVRSRFRLVRQGPTVDLEPDLGKKGRARYRVDPPLLVKKGDYIGVSAVTWLPAFAVNLDAAGNYWLASRPKKRCTTPPSSSPKRFAAYYRRNEAQLRTSTAKVYQCTYTTARLLYWARIVPEPAEPQPPQPTP